MTPRNIALLVVVVIALLFALSVGAEEPVGQAKVGKNAETTLLFYTSECTLRERAKNLQFRVVWRGGKGDINGCWTLQRERGIVVVYFSDGRVYGLLVEEVGPADTPS